MKIFFSLQLKNTIFFVVFLFSMSRTFLSAGVTIDNKLFSTPATPFIAAIGNSQDEIRASIGIIIDQAFLDNNSNTISESGNYILSEGVAGPININQNNVWLNLNGYTVTSSAGNNGIVVDSLATTGYANVTIFNGYINGPGTSGTTGGIRVNKNCSCVTIERLNIKSFTNGIFFIDDDTGIKRCKVVDCIIKDCTTAIYAQGLYKGIFENIIVGYVATGFYLDGVYNVYFYHCKVMYATGGLNMGFSGSENIIFKECFFERVSQNYVFYFQSASMIEMRGCTISYSSSGPCFFSCDIIEVRDCNFSDNGIGLDLNNTSNAVIKNNIFKISEYGINIDGSSNNNTVSENQFFKMNYSIINFGTGSTFFKNISDADNYLGVVIRPVSSMTVAETESKFYNNVWID